MAVLSWQDCEECRSWLLRNGMEMKIGDTPFQDLADPMMCSWVTDPIDCAWFSEV
jgi:hypothetical protein